MNESIPAFKVIFFPTKLSQTGIIAQEDKPLEWIYLHHRGRKILIAYFTLFAQLVNQRGHDINRCMNFQISIIDCHGV